jgi:hypothetical protein
MKGITLFKAVLIFIISLALISCIEFDPGGQKALIKTAARIAGYKLAKDNPDFGKTVISPAKTLLVASNSATPEQFVKELFPKAVNLLKKNIEDPLILSSINDVLSLIRIDVEVPVQSDQIQAALTGFIEGIELVIINNSKGN